MPLFVLFLLALFVKLKFNLRLLAVGQANLRGVTLNLFGKNDEKKCVKYHNYCCQF